MENTRPNRTKKLRQPAVHAHASLDGVLMQRSSSVLDQVGSTREYTLCRNTGCRNSKMIPYDTRQSRVRSGVGSPPLQNIHITRSLVPALWSALIVTIRLMTRRSAEAGTARVVKVIDGCWSANRNETRDTGVVKRQELNKSFTVGWDDLHRIGQCS